MAESLPKIRIYIDTMIFVKFLYNTSHKLHPICKKFFHEIQDGKFIGVTSSITRIEYIAVLKKLLAEKDEKIIDNEIKKELTRFDKFIEDLGIEYYDSDDLTKSINIFSICFQRVMSSKPFQGKDNQWRGLGCADSIVLIMAERSSSKYIATNDDGFRQIKSSVLPCIIKDKYIK